MSTADRVEFAMSTDAGVRIAPGGAELVSEGAPPRKLPCPMLTLETRINGQWRGLRIVQLYWEETERKFAMDGEYTNVTSGYELYEGRVRLLCAGRSVLEFPDSPAFALSPGVLIIPRCRFSLGHSNELV